MFQDGSYLAELLMSKGYKVHGIIRRSSSFNTARIEHLYSNPITHHADCTFNLHYGDMTDSSCLIKLISTIQPTEVYHLAAQSHVKVNQSFRDLRNSRFRFLSIFPSTLLKSTPSVPCVFLMLFTHVD